MLNSNKIASVVAAGAGRGFEEAQPCNSAAADALCYHCGTPCAAGSHTREDHRFCCRGCLTVYELLTENGLGHFYDLGRGVGTRVGETAAGTNRFAYLDDPVVRGQLVNFSDGKTSRVIFHVPAIHCIACVWLLENLFQLHPGIGESRVNFPRKEVAITFEDAAVPLSEVVKLLSSLGYEPSLKLADLDAPRPNPVGRKLCLQLGVAGFAFGNTMLLSFPAYLGLDHLSGFELKTLFGYISLLLALPVLIFCASDYWRAAWLCVRRRMLTIDFPIALGIAALFAQSAFEIISGRGEGYLDSLAGLLFFLLCGKFFQQKTYARLTFDHDYKSFFPLSVTRINNSGEETVSLAQLRVGDRLVLRHGELVPADARLVSGPACIDYSFVTGESEPISRREGDYLYAGGQQVGGAIEVEMLKPVSQSYLTSLWSHEAFQKPRDHSLESLTNLFSRRFTRIVLGVAIGAALWWSWQDADRAVKAFASVLIVACPCALALAAPFTLGTAQRVLARAKVFIKNPLVLETMARVSAIVFDKTGTLTTSATAAARFQGEPLQAEERRQMVALARQSTHPASVRLAGALAAADASLEVTGFLETPGCGVEGSIQGQNLMLGSRSWFAARRVAGLPGEQGTEVPETFKVSRSEPFPAGSSVCVAINGKYRGEFCLNQALRPEADELLSRLASGYDLALLSGDNERSRAQFSALFGSKAALHFNQNPFQKLEFIQDLRTQGETVMMVGDGLNDAGALKQSDLGVAVVENIGAFSPACDVILEATRVARLHEVLRYSRAVTRIIRVSFLLSSLYNVVGLSIAARGLLSPVVCAILMPLSSVTVVAFACGVTSWCGRRMITRESGADVVPVNPLAPVIT